MLVWKEVERSKRPAPLKETSYLCYFEFIFTPEQFCNFFLFANRIFTIKAAKLICCAYFRNKESLVNAVPNPLFKMRICGLWWHPMKSQESTEKWQVTAFCSTYWSQHLNGKILPYDGSLWRYETHHMHKAELRDWCSKTWHNLERGLSHAGTHMSPAACGLFLARAQRMVLWNHRVLCLLSGLTLEVAYQARCCPHSANEKSWDTYYIDISKDGGKKDALLTTQYWAMHLKRPSPCNVVSSCHSDAFSGSYLILTDCVKINQLFQIIL